MDNTRLGTDVYAGHDLEKLFFGTAESNLMPGFLANLKQNSHLSFLRDNFGALE
jgi:hypothetical protein